MTNVWDRCLAIGCVALMLWLPSARAEACGGGGGGGGGGGHSCRETSAIVGEQHCGRFGDWDVASIPPLTFEVVGGYSLLAPGDLEGSAVVHHSGYTYGVTSQGSAAASVGGGGFRARIGFGDHFYAGGEVVASGGPVPHGMSVVGSAALPSVETSNVQLYVPAAFLGAEVVLGRLVGLRAELAVGAWIAGVQIPTGTCHDATLIGQTTLLVMPRAALDVWLSPWLTLGVSGGVDLIDAPDRFQVGVSLGFHTRAYDGAGA